MAEIPWVDQSLSMMVENPLSKDDRRFLVNLDGQEVSMRWIYGPNTKEMDVIVLHPRTRSEANQLSMILRRASRRLEEIAKGLN